MKTLREFVAESSREHAARVLPDDVKHYMHQTYQGAEPELPRNGQYHYASAVDHLADRAHDKFGAGRVHGHDYVKMAKEVVKHYNHDDTAESRRAEKKKKITPKLRSLKIKTSKPEKRWDELPPKRKGIGSR